MKAFVLTQLQNLINGYVQLDPYTETLRQPLVGKTCGISLKELPFTVYMQFTPQAIAVMPDCDAPQVLIRGSLAGFAALSFESKNSVFADKRVEISGDTETAQQFQQFWQNIHIDWEEQLARWMGDPLANWLGKGIQLAKRAVSYAGHSLTTTVSEYLQEEIRLLPPKAEVRDFMDAVDSLRLDTERLAARIARLTQQ